MTAVKPRWPIPLEFPDDPDALEMYRGDASGRNGIRITVVDSEDAPVDLTLLGDTWTSQGRSIAGVITDLQVDATDAATGVIVVSVPDGSSAELPDSLDFDVQVTGGDISPLTVFKGTLPVDGEVTTP